MYLLKKKLISLDFLLGSHHEGRVTSQIFNVNISSLGDQSLDNIQFAVHCSENQRSFSQIPRPRNKEFIELIGDFWQSCIMYYYTANWRYSVNVEIKWDFFFQIVCLNCKGQNIAGCKNSLPGHAFDIMFGSFCQQEFDNFHVVILSGNNKNGIIDIGIVHSSGNHVNVCAFVNQNFNWFS